MSFGSISEEAPTTPSSSSSSSGVTMSTCGSAAAAALLAANPALHRRYSRDVDPVPSVWQSSLYSHFQPVASGHSSGYSYGLPSHLTAFRSSSLS